MCSRRHCSVASRTPRWPAFVSGFPGKIRHPLENPVATWRMVQRKANSRIRLPAFRAMVSIVRQTYRKLTDNNTCRSAAQRSASDDPRAAKRVCAKIASGRTFDCGVRRKIATARSAICMTPHARLHIAAYLQRRRTDLCTLTTVLIGQWLNRTCSTFTRAISASWEVRIRRAGVFAFKYNVSARLQDCTLRRRRRRASPRRSHRTKH